MSNFPDEQDNWELNPLDSLPVERNWWDNWPTTLERAAEILHQRAIYIQSISEEGIQLRRLLEWAEQEHQKIEDEIRQLYPLAYFKPSYEQSLVLNAWWCGFDFPIIFAANRIGKTTVCVVNGALWVFPNNPDWQIFQPYEDEFHKHVHVLCRPPLKEIATLQNFLRENPHLAGDPQFPYYDEPSGNHKKFEALRTLFPQVFTPAWPAPPIQEGGTIWLGAPDTAYHREIILKEWKKWLPQPAIQRWSESEGYQGFTVTTLESGNPRATVIDFICKSYESKDTKWSGAAVLGIILTEGIEQDVLDEVKQRIKENGFASWDYTPYEAANVGRKTHIAQRVYEKKEPLPLSPYVFTGFAVDDAPLHILPAGKKADLLRMWGNKEQGKARIKGLFFSSSPLILSKLERPFHCLPLSFEELRRRYPTANLYRALDPGYDHPTACAWGLLTPHNVWFIYRFYSESGKTIPERCKDIITLSNNTQHRKYWGHRETDYTLVECHTSLDSEVYNATFADYHTFKKDETSGQIYATRYINEGLSIIPSATTPPRDRALKINNCLDKIPYYTHPLTGQTPSSKLFFLINEPGVDEALQKMEELYWDRYKSGDRKGQPKDEVPKDFDDELDAACYLVDAPIIWVRYTPSPVLPPRVPDKFATLQFSNSNSPLDPNVPFPVGAPGGFGNDYDYLIH